MDLIDELKLRPAAGARRLVAEYRQRLYQVAYRLSLNAAEANDLCLRTLQRAIERIHSYRPTGSFFQWLYTILVNFRRMDVRRKAANMLDFTDELPDEPSDAPDPADPQISNVQLSQNSITRRVTVTYDLDEAAVVTMDVLTNGTAIVGSYAPNDWGLYDTAGNVWEWYLDWYADDITAHGGKRRGWAHLVEDQGPEGQTTCRRAERDGVRSPWWR